MQVDQCLVLLNRRETRRAQAASWIAPTCIYWAISIDRLKSIDWIGEHRTEHSVQIDRVIHDDCQLQ